MQVPATNSIASDSAPPAASNLSSQLLSQGDFLKLLIAQMTAQDPINPMDNQDMLAQMVQFSTLQGNTRLQGTLSDMQNSQGLLQANALLGRQVGIQVDESTFTQGVVSGVDLDRLPLCDQTAQYYQHQPVNMYASTLHKNAIGQKAYAFGYDDVCDQSSVGITKNPTQLVLTVHPVAG